jgi:Kef-type K+ transport system membrane component KefB
VQAFAAGAALCSTSLGTTFTVLATSGLAESRLGVVLTSAAMMDDVVGLIMVQIISSLGTNSTFTEITVIRPVFVSLAFAVAYPLMCVFIARPVMRMTSNYARQSPNANFMAILSFVCQTTILIATITGATYAGTSNLFAAYLAGAAITWLDDTVPDDKRQATPNDGSTITRTPSCTSTQSHSRPSNVGQTHASGKGCSGREIFERFYSPALEAILRPFFFASIGFAIPISSMFSGHVVWRGIIYTILMLIGKLVCGLWLIRFVPMPHIYNVASYVSSIKFLRCASNKTKTESAATSEKPATPSATNISGQHLLTSEQQGSGLVQDATPEPNAQNTSNETNASTSTVNTPANTSRKRARLPRPKSLYPAAILGSAMVSRGEIGFLISSVAESRGVFGEAGSSDEFLVVTWAILLCTLIGPITVGLMVKRVKRLQEAERQRATGHEDPLGIWGVLPSRSATS